MELALGSSGSAGQSVDEAQIERAVRQARLAELSAQSNAAARHLGKLKSLQSEWGALEADLLQGDAGRRIAASSEHFRLASDVLQRERPTAQQIAHWEQQLNALAEPVADAASGNKTIAVTDEYTRLLSDLGQELAKSAKAFAALDSTIASTEQVG